MCHNNTKINNLLNWLVMSLKHYALWFKQLEWQAMRNDRCANACSSCFMPHFVRQNVGFFWTPTISGELPSILRPFCFWSTRLPRSIFFGAWCAAQMMDWPTTKRDHVNVVRHGCGCQKMANILHKQAGVHWDKVRDQRLHCEMSIHLLNHCWTVLETESPRWQAAAQLHDLNLVLLHRMLSLSLDHLTSPY